jgi:hypothetical protein
MRAVKTFGKTIVTGLFFLLMSGCVCVEVIDNVKNPGAYFRKARREIGRLQSRRRFQRCPEQVHLLVYDKDEKKIVKITTPVWLVDGCTDLERRIDKGKDELDLEIRYDFDRKKFRNLKSKRPGFLAEINERGNRVLIWLE